MNVSVEVSDDTLEKKKKMTMMMKTKDPNEEEVKI
mgnify:CR=1 FL=1